jgi:hypothetical protein
VGSHKERQPTLSNKEGRGMSELKGKIEENFKICSPELKNFLRKNEVEYLYQLFFLNDLNKDQNYGLKREINLILQKKGLSLLDFDCKGLSLSMLKSLSMLFSEGLICENTHESYTKQMHGFLCE